MSSKGTDERKVPLREEVVGYKMTSRCKVYLVSPDLVEGHAYPIRADKKLTTELGP